ncbi:MAG: nidogen-like domain-containing protein [Cyanobacteria bacterium P01_G01_bin.67]
MEKYNSSLISDPGNKEAVITELPNQAIASAQDLLQQFANSPDFTTNLELAFGSQVKPEPFAKIWQAEKFEFPTIEIVSRTEINNANGAFAISSNKIYLAQEFLLANQSNLDIVTNVLLEEYGHFVDHQLNIEDSPGDEGEIFAAIIQGRNLSEKELQELKQEDDTAIATINGEQVEIEQSFTELVSDLGGTAGFGENLIPRNDDGSSDAISLTPVFEDGFKFFGQTYTEFYINNNGNITFDSPLSTFTPTEITSFPIIAPFFADVDTREDNIEASSGGNSTGSNLVYYHFDPEADAITITWDDVGKFSNQTTPNAFQLIIRDLSEGDSEIEFLYEEVQWTVGGASEDVYARVGFSAGNGEDFYELPFSNNQEQLLQLETGTNIGVPGRFAFSLIDGEPQINEEDYSLLPIGPLHRFFEHEQGHHFYTADESETELIKSRSSVGRQGYEYEYEYEKFQILTQDTDVLTGEEIEGAKPVYRFFNTDIGSHLYTIDEEEKTFLLENSPEYNFEGVKFYAFESQEATEIPLIPVFKVLNNQSGTHLYTTKQDELDYIADNLPHFSELGDDGVAFYAFDV